MSTKLKWALILATVAMPAVSMAGYGSMANVEHDGGDVSLADMLIGGLLIWGVYALWKKFF